LKYSWSRDIPLNQAQVIVDEMNQTHHVMHIRKPDQLALNNCEPISASLRELFGLIEISDKRLFNESFGYHCAAAFKLPSTVCFVGTKPEVYSYPFHTNIIPQDKKVFIHTVDKFMEDSPWAGEKLYECPYDVENLFLITEIVESIKKQPKNKNAPKPTQSRMEQENLANLQSSDSLRNQDVGVAGLQSTNPIQSSVNQDGSPSNEVGNFIDNYFDKIYVINLDQRKDRLEQVQDQLKNANITKFERIPGVKITDKEFEKIPKENYAKFKTSVIKKEQKDKYIKGRLGQRQAHLNCIKDAKEKGYKKILILEDDVLVNSDANQLFSKIINEFEGNWDLLYIGGDYWSDLMTFKTISYAIDQKAFDEILKQAEPSGEELDYFYNSNILKKYRTLRSTTKLFKEGNFKSDILEKLKKEVKE